jgi:hypothetical protein
MKLELTRVGNDIDVEYSEDLLKSDVYAYASFLEDAIKRLQAELITQEQSVE